MTSPLPKIGNGVFIKGTQSFVEGKNPTTLPIEMNISVYRDESMAITVTHCGEIIQQQWFNRRDFAYLMRSLDINEIKYADSNDDKPVSNIKTAREEYYEMKRKEKGE